MAVLYKTKYFQNRNKWRQWLIENHSLANGIWFVYYKKHTGKPSVSYTESVEEALCYGWIDSTKKRLDDERYVHKFTPRKNKSNWSETNKNLVEKLIEEGKMTDAGMKKVIAAKQNGEWDKKDIKNSDFSFSTDILCNFQLNKKAFQFFQKLSSKQKAQYTAWIMSAKKEETRINRLKKLITELEKGNKLNLM
ncbi:MAG: YdeI/OmpD-associated family protein [Bacteroidota bacterium]